MGEFNHGVVRFAEADYEELLSYGILVMGIALIIFFALFVDTSKPTPTITALPTRKPTASVVSPVGSPVAVAPPPAHPEPIQPQPEPQPVTEEEPAHEPEAVVSNAGEQEAPATPKKTPKKKKEAAAAADLGHLLSPDGRRVSARLQHRTK